MRKEKILLNEPTGKAEKFKTVTNEDSKYHIWGNREHLLDRRYIILFLLFLLLAILQALYWCGVFDVLDKTSQKLVVDLLNKHIKKREYFYFYEP